MSALAALDAHQPQRLSDIVFERIAEAIVTGRLAPGESLRDQELAAQLGVSRMPVREALQRLERAGLIETAASRYTRVADLTPERVRDTLEHAGFLYGSVVRLATMRMTDEELGEALTLLGGLTAAGTNVTAFHDANRAFIAFMVDACRNASFRLRGDLLYTVEWVLRQFSFADHVLEVRGQLERLAQLIAARDADAAEHLVREIYGLEGPNAERCAEFLHDA